MFLRSTIRRKDGKEHRYWSVVEARRVAHGRVVQRPLLYLGEINSSQELAWRKSIEVLEEGSVRPRTLALFPEDRCEGVLRPGGRHERGEKSHVVRARADSSPMMRRDRPSSIPG
jgi:hypothetical protein